MQLKSSNETNRSYSMVEDEFSAMFVREEQAGRSIGFRDSLL
jgi:hypothetical protein